MSGFPEINLISKNKMFGNKMTFEVGCKIIHSCESQDQSVNETIICHKIDIINYIFSSISPNGNCSFVNQDGTNCDNDSGKTIHCQNHIKEYKKYRKTDEYKTRMIKMKIQKLERRAIFLKRLLSDNNHKKDSLNNLKAGKDRVNSRLNLLHSML